MIKKAWINSHDKSLMGKLKLVKNDLKVWNVSEFGNFHDNIKKLEREIHKWDGLANQRNLDENEFKARRDAQFAFWAWLKKKEMFSAQNSRAQWLKYGD